MFIISELDWSWRAQVADICCVVMCCHVLWCVALPRRYHRSSLSFLLPCPRMAVFTDDEDDE